MYVSKVQDPFGRAWHAACLVGAVVLFCPAVTFAEEPPTLAQARSAFIEGRELMDAQRFNEAAAKFAYAALAKNTPGLRYYIGSCQEQAGLLLEARESYRMAQDLLKSQPAADVEKLIPEAIERVSAAVPRLVIQGVPAGASLYVDGEQIRLNGEVEVNPGPRLLLISAPGYEDWEQAVTLGVSGSEVVTVSMKMKPEAQAVQASSTDQGDDDPENVENDSRSSVRPVVFWTGIGVATAGLATGLVGTVFFTGASRDKSEQDARIDDLSGGGDSACFEATGDLQVACRDYQSAGRRRALGANLMIAGYGAAGVGLVTALVAHLAWPDVKSSGDVGALRVTDRVRISGGAAPGRAFLSLDGSF